MKVITLKQPWATLIAKGYKEYEFRTWKTNYRGEILIHAGKGMDKEAMKRFEHLNLNYPSGAIIAIGTVTDCVFVDNNLKEQLIQKNPLIYRNLSNWQGYGFKLEDIREIEQISINGKLGLWNYDYINNK